MNEALARTVPSAANVTIDVTVGAATDVSSTSHPVRRPTPSDRTTLLASARAAALFLAPVATGAHLNRAAVTALVAEQVRNHGVSGVAGDVAYEFGEYPDTALGRMRWARETVAAVYQHGRQVALINARDRVTPR